MDAQEEVPQGSSRSSRKRRFRMSILLALICIILLGAGLLTHTQLSEPKIKIPSKIIQQASFPVYMPQKLPEKYTVEHDSFSFQEEVLVFKARDDAGGSIVFSEQRKPNDFDFDAFYKKQFRNVASLDGTAHTTVSGKVGDGRPFLSIVTDETWIFMTASNSLSDDDMRRIANSIERG